MAKTKSKLGKAPLIAKKGINELSSIKSTNEIKNKIHFSYLTSNYHT